VAVELTEKLGVYGMPPEGEKFDELLSSYIDGALSDVERDIVEKAAEGDARVAERILQLRQQAADVAEVGQKLSQQALRRHNGQRRRSMAEAVIAQAREHAIHVGLNEDHYLFGSPRMSQPVADKVVDKRNLPNRRTNRRWRAAAAWLTGAAALAAALLIALGPWRSDDEVSPHQVASEPFVQPAEAPLQPGTSAAVAENDAAADSSNEQFVGQFGQMTFVMVADVQITEEALRSRSLEKILTAAGIPPVQPVLADGKILKALDDSRMIVDADTRAAQHIFLTVIRANMQDIDTALQNIWRDSRSFPKVGLNMAIDARAALTREILNSAAGRLSLSESFAIPITTVENAPQMAASSPLLGSGEGVAYVSSARRAAGWSQGDPLIAEGSDSMATILLVTHLVE
jgi:hypothetical protein